MNRRSFFKNFGVPGLGLVLLPNDLYSVNCSAARDQLDLSETTITELQSWMASGKATSESLTSQYLQTILSNDKQGAKLNAVLEMNQDALSIARRCDEERRSGKIRSSLHGIPLLVKDNIDTADKMMTTAGSLALLGNYASQDAFIIHKLREAGAVILGKANLTEWSNFRSTRAASGWSSRGGQTKNACVLDRNPSGSSSGSAVAVAANLIPVAIGTETNGSVISPASHNGIVGIKPTLGMASRSGIIPISSSQDTPGPLARTVTDAAILLGVIAGEDSQDDATAAAGKDLIDFTNRLTKDALKGKRVGIEKSHLEGHEGVVRLFREAVDTIKKLGAVVMPVDFLATCNKFNYQQYTLFLFEFKNGINKYLEKTTGTILSLEHLIEFNRKNEEEVMPFFKQEIFEQAQQKGNLSSKEYMSIVRRRKDFQTLITDVFNTNNLDCICGVSTGLPGCIDLLNGDYDTGYYFCSPAAASGFPHITVPMGKVHHLPAGLSFMGEAWSDAELIGMAYAYEQASLKREPPELLSTIPVK
jgi:amidase